MWNYYHFLLQAKSIGLLLALGAIAGAADEEAPDPLAEVKSAMRAAEFEEAIAAVGKLADPPGPVAAEGQYLKALAQYYLTQYQASVDTAGALLADHPETAWLRKARFLKARGLVALRKYEEAEVIYQEEAHRLLSEARKHEIAAVILSFADALAKKPDPSDVGAPPPDFNKAYTLYGKVLEMEIGRNLRDEVMYKRAIAILAADNFGQAIQDFQAYLDEFDPDWTGAVGTSTRTSGRKRENPKPAGEFILSARFHLTEAQLKAGQHPVARINAEDLLTMIGDDAEAETELQANTAWLLVQTYQMPTPPANELEKAVQVTQKFLKDHPNHPRAVQAAWYIAEAYRNHGRADQAIAEYQRFIDGGGYGLPKGDAATDKLSDLAKSPAELREEWQKTALFYIGQIRFGQKQYEQAIESWTAYTRKFPNGPNWSDAQRGIVDAEYQAAIDAVADEDYGKARERLEAFLEKYPLDGRAAQTLFLFGQMEYTAAEELKKQEADAKNVEAAYQRAIDRWQRLVSKYPNTEQSSLALYRIGMIYEEQLGNLEKALETYRQLTWGSWAAHAQARIAEMTQKRLAVTTEQKYRTSEQPKVKINTRNIEKLTFKQYFLDLEAYFRKTHAVGRVDGLDIDLIQPDKTWEVTIDAYKKYAPLQQQVEIPFENNKAGVCIVNVASDDFEATTLVVRSDLDLIMKTSRRELLVFVQDMLAGKPAKGVKLLVSNGEKVLATGETGADGVFIGQYDELKQAEKARVFAIHEGSVASNLLDLSGLQLSEGLAPKGYLYTDRPAYQPGQTVKFRGILRKVKDGSYAVPEGEEYDIAITDSAGRLLYEEKMSLSEFGTFDGEFPLNSQAPVGSYQLVARQEEGPAYASTFQVQKFQLEKLKIDLETERDVYFRGEQVELNITAVYYWGQPAANKQIRYRLPDGRELVESTDAEGKLKVTFDTSGMQPGSPLRFAASIEGENVAAAKSAMLAVQGFNIAVKPSRPLILSGEPLEVEVKTTTPDGEPVGQKVTLRVLRRAVVQPNPVLSGVPWINVAQKPAEEITVLERDVETGEESGLVTIQLDDAALEEGGEYVLRATGQDRFEQVVTGQATVQVSDDQDATKLRLFSESDTLEVGSEAKVRLHSRVDAKLALVTFEGETIISHRIVPLKQGFNPMDIEVGHEYFPNFRLAVSLMDGQQLRSTNKPFRVERKLNVAVEPKAEAYAPGEMGEVVLTVTDQLGQPVRGELSLALVDEALFALFPESTPDILEFFQHDAHRHAEFREASTCDFRYEATTRQVIEAVQSERERLAREALQEQELSELSARQDELRQEFAGRAGGMGGGQSMNAPMDAAQEPAPPPTPEPATAMAVDGLTPRLSEGDEAARKSDSESNFGLNGAFAREGRRDFDNSSGLRGESGDEEASLQAREELPEAGWWVGAITTDDEGKETVEVPMPETTTEWRLTARGVTVDTLVGQAQANVLTRRDFFITLKAPRSLQEGDSLQLIARVHNLTDYEGTARLRLNVLGGEELTSRLAERNVEVDIKKQGIAEVVFDAVAIPSAPRLKLEVEARAGDLADALAQTIPVRPWGLEFADQAGGTADSSATAYVELPGGRDYQTRWLTISIGPSLERSVIDLALGGGVVPMPRVEGLRHPCIFPPPPGWGRLPGSDLLAVVRALDYAKAADAPSNEIEKLTRRARSLVSALVVSQRPDGGWSWRGENDNTDWGASAVSFWALSEAKRLGLVVHADTFNNAQTYLKNRFTSLNQTDNDAKAVVLHALSANNAADFAHLNRLHRERNNLSEPALAYTALALANQNRNDLAGEVLGVLEQKTKASGKRIFWEGSPHEPWLNDQVETTAIAALAMMQVKPESSKIAEAINFLLERKGAWGFTPAKAHGPAVAAIARYYQQGKHATDDYQIEVEVNNKPLETIASETDRGTRLLSVPAEMLVAGKNQVDFLVAGRGEFAYGVSFRGFSSELKDPETFRYPHVRSRSYRHAELEYRGRPIGAESTSPVEHVEPGQRVKVFVDLWESYERPQYLVVEEHLPAGMMLVDGSLTGQFDHHVVDGDRILMYYRSGQNVQDYSYELIGYASGTYRALPTVIRNSLAPSQMRIGKPATLTVLRPGEKSDDPYKMNDAERFALGNLYFEDGLYKEAAPYLTHLFEHNRKYNEQHVARMLLWIYTAEGFYDAQQIVNVFEVLRERFPTLEIPYDKILTVGRAYRDLGEFERAYQVYRATIDASFINDSNVSAVLEDEGQFLGSIDYQEDLWRDYPDTAAVTTAYFAISQSLYQKAPQAHELAKEQRQIALSRGDDEPPQPPNKIAMLRETIRLLSEFLTLYPKNPLADDAAFSMANALLDLKQYELVVEACSQFRERFEKSDFQNGFQYMIALGHFWQRQHDQALAAAKIVADGESKDRDFARYIIGQIYHAENEPKQAIEWYQKVAQQYADAQQAIEYFEAKRVAIDEVNIFKPGEPVKLKLDYRNIAEARCQVYRVDLMRLYLREKNLSNVTKVNLAGIQPMLEKTIPLGDGHDYVDKSRTIELDLKEEGAYLVICRGDDLFASALALVTPLEVEVQQDTVSGRVRANVINAKTGQYVPEVHVKAIGSSDTEFRSGETDLRGVFVADNLHGKATIIAREGDARYAFYRGDEWLGAQEQQSAESQPAAPQSGQEKSAPDYQFNLRMDNGLIQRGNYEAYDKMRREPNQGVEVQEAR